MHTVDYPVPSVLRRGATRMMAALVGTLAIATTVPAGAEDWTPFWSTTHLSEGRAELAATVSGGKAYFGGGWSGGDVSNVVDVYDLASGSWTVEHLSQGRKDLGAASSNGEVLFGGGYGWRIDNPNWIPSDAVDIYDTATSSWSTANLSQARGAVAGAAANGKVLFGGGFTTGAGSGSYISQPTVDIYDVTTNHWSSASLSQARGGIAATSTGTQVFFAGGWSESHETTSNRVDIYDAASGTWSTSNSPHACAGGAAISAGNQVFIAGGYAERSIWNKAVDIYDLNKGTWSSTSLSVARYGITAATIGKTVFFAGGYSMSNAPSDVIDVYNIETQTWSNATLSEARYYLSSVTIGNQILFAGGWSAYGWSKVVDVYTLQNYQSITSSKSWTLISPTTVAGRVQLNTGATLNLGDFDLTVGSISGVAPISLNARTLTVGSDNTNTTYSGALSDLGLLVKTGTGRLTFTSANTYAGPTTVNAGSLVLGSAGSLTSPVTVNSGGTLGGSGRLISDVSVNSGGHIAPGDSTGTLTLIGGLSLAHGALLDYDLGSLAASDKIWMPYSTLTLTGQQFSDFTFVPAAEFGPGTYTLIHARYIHGSGLGLNLTGQIKGLSATLAVSGNDLVLRVVPEPSTFLLLIPGGTVLLGYLWRRRNRE